MNRDELRNLLDKYKQQDEGILSQTALRDLLTDLRHLADEQGLDFDFALEGSEEVFAEEQEFEQQV